ncbi:MAG: hypothetical protein MR775_01480 [Erysipelotrichaceae bacterium]|nr:hypothetical protein [Erysipelotrichaceae bacterium]
MRRLIAYISMAITMLIAVGVAFTPVFTSMNPGREFTSGNEIVYRLNDNEGTNLENDADAAEKVAAEMRNRLETYQIEDYSVRVEGNDTVRVSLSVKDETQLSYITRYLSFSGENFSLAGEVEETRVMGDEIFVNSVARIERQQDVVPYVVIPVSDTTKVKTLIESVSSSEEEKSISRKAEDEGETEQSTPDIFLWANWVEGDTYEKANNDKAITGQKIICSFVSSNIWYREGLKDDAEPTEIQYLCGFANSDGEYDVSKLKEANELATYLVNMFNASKYEYQVENLFVTQSNSGVTNNNILVPSTAENLLVFGNSVNVAWSTTLIATIVAIVISFLILVMFYRVTSLGIVANTSSTLLLTYLIFTSLGATFNIAAIIGGLLITAMSLASSILYCNKFKEEVYKGRSIRKANQEATKKIMLPTLDMGVITFFAGLMIYLLGGNALKPLGIVLFFGAVVSLLMTLVIFRLETWLLTNDTKMQENYKAFNIDEKLVPNAMEDEKPTYVAPYENTDFTKKRKPIGIVSLILAVASVVGISVFGALNASPLNVSAATAETTQIYVSIKGDTPTLDTEEAYKNDVLAKIKVGDEKLSYSNVEVCSREEYNYEHDITTKYTYFVTSVDHALKGNEYSVELAGAEVKFTSLEEALFDKVAEIEGTSDSDIINCEIKLAHETVKAPNQGFVALACSISLVGAFIYLALRYSFSRGLAGFVISGGATLISYGLLVLFRIQTSAITSIVMPIAMLIALFGAIMYFEKEKEMFADNKNATDEERKEIVKKATSLSAAPLFITSILLAYLAIDYFGFGNKSFSIIFAGMLLSIVIAALFVTTLLGSLSEGFRNKFKNIKLPTIKIDRNKKQRIKMQNKPKTSEPEETIFIGIND